MSKVSEFTASRGKLFHRLMMLLKNENLKPLQRAKGTL